MTKAYTAGHFELLLDGHKTSAYLKSVEGGHSKAEIVDEPIGPTSQRIKHVSVRDVDPVSIEFGLSASWDILSWIAASWRRDFQRRNGSITHADFNLKGAYEQTFTDALITETTFPALDGASKDAAYLKVKFQPERITSQKLGQDQSVLSPSSEKQKLWLASGFRFSIDGVDGLEYTNKIESFAIKQGIKKLHTGEDPLPQIEPTKIDFPPLTGTISLAHADGLLKWHKEVVDQGQRASKSHKSGSIEFLAPNRKDVIFRINLFETFCTSVAVVQSQANADQIKRCKFEIHVGRMELDGKGSGFT